MNIDELRKRLCELSGEYSHSRIIRKQIQDDIRSLDGIMKRNFDAYWDNVEQNYTQGV